MSSSEEMKKEQIEEKKERTVERSSQLSENAEEQEEDDYEEAEPVLAYSRMKNDFNEILTKDSVSCIKAGSKVIKSLII